MTHEQIMDALDGFAQGHYQTTVVTMWGHGEIKKQSIAILKFSPQDDEHTLVIYTEDGYTLSRIFSAWDLVKDTSVFDMSQYIERMINDFYVERKAKGLVK